VIYLFFYKLQWLPGSGRLDPSLTAPPHVTGLFTVDALLAGQWGTFLDAVMHLILPASVLALHNIGVLTRFTRAAVQEVLGEPYINVARAKGLPELTIVRHILRAALAPVLTLISLMLADVLTGTVLVENIFGWPGIGRYAFQAATTLDLPAISGVVIFVVLVYVLINFVVDVLYTVIDPRLRTT
jgi:peptide/nickel transport system permease protein